MTNSGPAKRFRSPRNGILRSRRKGFPRRRRPINGHLCRSPSAIVNSEWVAVALSIPSGMMLTTETHEAKVAGSFTKKR